MSGIRFWVRNVVSRDVDIDANSPGLQRPAWETDYATVNAGSVAASASVRLVGSQASSGTAVASDVILMARHTVDDQRNAFPGVEPQFRIQAGPVPSSAGETLTRSTKIIRTGTFNTGDMAAASIT
jgi:hypothetical protein